MAHEKQEHWKRSDSVPFPSVWKRFNGRKEINGVIPKFWIQDIPEDQFEEVVKYMSEGFVVDEPLCKYSNLTSDKLSIERFREMWRSLLKDKLGLVCYMENPDPNGKPIIAAMNCTHLMSKYDPPLEETKEAVKATKILDFMNFISKQKDFFEKFHVDGFLNAMGLYVLPEFRGQGLGLELLKAREPLCRAVGIKATVTLFTATASQILASRAGFKELLVVPYTKVTEEHPEFSFPGIEKHTECLKYMYVKYD